MAKIRWLGHACFAVEGEGLIVVTDPHDGRALGLRAPDVKADIVLVSHPHYDHADGIDLVSKPDTKVYESFEGRDEYKGVKIVGVRAYHDKSYGEIRGENYIYVFELEGIRFCHLGDLGHVLEKEQLDSIGKVDVLFIPVGGVFTIDAEEAKEVVEQLKPRLVIPMHYKIPGLNLPIEGVERFTRGMKNVEVLDTDTIEITKETLPTETKVVVLKYLG
ncbi:MAG: MBL fold metallo-hydrolase [Thermoprotei archaeon]